MGNYGLVPLCPVGGFFVPFAHVPYEQNENKKLF